MKEIDFLPESLEDIVEIELWYDLQKPGLGSEFLINLHNLLSVIRERPNLFVTVFENFRTAPVKRFPYNVYYQVIESKILIYGVIHNHRSPKVWKNRLNL